MSSNAENPGAKKVDLKRLKPYGDIMGDGTIQICFTLPVDPSPEAKEAAIQLVEKLGLDNIKVATMEKASEGFSMFVIYANMKATVDFTEIHVVKVDATKRGRDEVDELIRDHIGRKLIVLGACTGYDAHTVGIDAIMNMKGFAGDYGLERYQWLDARNLGAQVPNNELLKLAIEQNADAVLVSKVVTQHNIHVRDLKDLMKQAEKMGLKERLIFVAGGPRVTHPLALECGFDAGFGVGTKPSDVASYIVEEFLRRREQLEGVPNPLRIPEEASKEERGHAEAGKFLADPFHDGEAPMKTVPSGNMNEKSKKSESRVKDPGAKSATTKSPAKGTSTDAPAGKAAIARAIGKDAQEIVRSAVQTVVKSAMENAAKSAVENAIGSFFGISSKPAAPGKKSPEPTSKGSAASKSKKTSASSTPKKKKKTKKSKR